MEECSESSTGRVHDRIAPLSEWIAFRSVMAHRSWLPTDMWNSKVLSAESISSSQKTSAVIDMDFPDINGEIGSPICMVIVSPGAIFSIVSVIGQEI